MTILNKVISFFLGAVFLLSGITVNYGDEVKNGEYRGLKDVFSDCFDMGTCVKSNYLSKSENVDFMLKNFSSVTPEYELKLPTIHPAENLWNFGAMDKIADFCRENNLKLRGHCLVWGNLNNWMVYDEDGGFVDKETYFARQYDYFQTVMTRYGDIIKVWDVVNEPFNFDNSGAFKNNPIYQICGEEYITRSFEQAREIAPNATLVLNETGILKNDTKQRYFFKYMKKWLDAGVPIDAVGIQAHWQTFSVTETPLRLSSLLKKMAKLDLKELQITEMDLTLYPTFVEKDYESIPQWMRDFQSMRYQQYFRIFREYSDIISSVTFWGIADGFSYHRDNHANDEVLLFDESMRPKDAYFGVVDF